MSFAKKYSKVSPKFNVRIHQPAYTSLPDLYAEHGKNHVYPIAGIYINTKGKYGPQACIAMNDSLLVNLPQHLTEVCEQMRADQEAVDAINHGQAGFKIYEYASKSGVIRYSVDWVDLQ